MMNDLPTIFEIVSGTAKKQSKEKSSVSNHSSTKSKSNSKVVIMVPLFHFPFFLQTEVLPFSFIFFGLNTLAEHNLHKFLVMR